MINSSVLERSEDIDDDNSLGLDDVIVQKDVEPVLSSIDQQRSYITF